jgi:hypothetical protein
MRPRSRGRPDDRVVAGKIDVRELDRGLIEPSSSLARQPERSGVLGRDHDVGRDPTAAVPSDLTALKTHHNLAQ